MALGPRGWSAIACVAVGAPLAAWGLANGSLLIGLAGLALVFAFVYLVMEAMNKAAKPTHEIPKSSNPAWNMKDETPPASKADDGGPR